MTRIKTFYHWLTQNADVILLLTSTLITWFGQHSSVSSKKYSIKPQVMPFFMNNSPIEDVYTGDYNDLQLRYSNEPIYALYLYAEWDADSIHLRSVLESVQFVIPYKIVGMRCWHVESSCHNSFKPTSFPQLFVQPKNQEVLHYNGIFSYEALVLYLQRVVLPLTLLRSDEMLYSMLARNEIVVVGNFSRNDDLAQFYGAALKYISLHPNLRTEFIVLSSESTAILHEIGVASNSVVTAIMGGYNMSFQYIGPMKTMDIYTFLLEVTQEHHQNYTSRLLFRQFPLDITPNGRRSTQLYNELMSGPALLLIGPGLSLLEITSSEITLLHRLYAVYTRCNGSYESEHSRRQLQHLLAETRDSSWKLQRRLSSVCVRWWQEVAKHFDCRANTGLGEETQSSELHGKVDDHCYSKLHNILADMHNNSTLRDALAPVAVDLLQEVYPKVGDETALQTGPSPSFSVINYAWLVEYLHTKCCYWQMKRRMTHTQASNHSDGVPIVKTDQSHEVNEQGSTSSVVAGLGCIHRNMSLQFYLLDSNKQPELAWQLGGYDASFSPSLAASIVYAKQETVYRLENTVTYNTLSQFIADFHATKLRPWLRHQRAAVARTKFSDLRWSPGEVSHIFSSDQFLYLLNTTTSGGSASSNGETSGSRPAGDGPVNLVVLFYSTTCGYSSGGNGALRQFNLAAEFFSSWKNLHFTKIDVSVVDLPWEFRVGNVPSIIFFPSGRPSHSSVVPAAMLSSPQLFSHLVAYLLGKLANKPLSTRAATLQSTNVNELMHTLTGLLQRHNPEETQTRLGALVADCVNRTTGTTQLMCVNTIRLAIGNHVAKLQLLQILIDRMQQRVLQFMIHVNARWLQRRHQVTLPLVPRDVLLASQPTYKALMDKFQSYKSRVIGSQGWLSNLSVYLKLTPL